ncbi:MAG: response regulator [Synechococcales bacterium]|nr:response regulator [Synechococcales bacterium]
MEDRSSDRLILVVEDNPEHSQQIANALREGAISYQIETIADGAEALQRLRQQDPYQSAPRPILILLDLNLPGKNGQEILAAIKADPRLRRIPIVVLSSSGDEFDIFNTYTLQGNCYVVKTGDLDELFNIVRRIEQFWLGIVTLPGE